MSVRFLLTIALFLSLLSAQKTILPYIPGGQASGFPTGQKGDGSSEVRLSLRHVLAAVERLRQTPAPGDSVIALRDVCHFLRVRGEGLQREAFEREVGLTHSTFERLENAAGMQGDLDQIQNGLAAAARGLGAAGPLLTEAVALGKAIARVFAEAPEVAGKAGDGVDDACRVLEQLFRFTGAAAIERATGVRREMIEQMRSAAAFAGRRDG